MKSLLKNIISCVMAGGILIIGNQAFAIQTTQSITSKVDCVTGNDKSAVWGDVTKPYFSLKKAVEDTVLQKDNYAGSVFTVTVKDNCALKEVPNNVNGNLEPINISNFNNNDNELIIKSETANGFFSFQTKTQYAFNITNSTNPITIKNMIFKGGDVGYITVDGNNNNQIVVDNSKFEISNYLIGGGNFEIKNSLIEINKTLGSKGPFRFSSYFHNNRVNYLSNTVGVSDAWLFQAHSSDVCIANNPNSKGTCASNSKKQGIVNNEINISIDLSTGNNYFMSDFNNNITNTTFERNKVTYSGPGTAKFVSFIHSGHCDGNTTRNYLYIFNNQFSGFSALGDLTPAIRCRYAYPARFVILNNTFDQPVTSNYSDSNRGRVYNNINLDVSNSANKNFTTNNNSGFRIGLDLNRDGNIVDNEIVTDTFCTPKPSCQSTNQPLILFPAYGQF